MLLRNCRFLVSSYELRFVVFSDQPCRILHEKTVLFDTPGGSERMDWYQIQPAAEARWVAVQETLDYYFDKQKTRFFLHEGLEFVERKQREIPAACLAEILQRICHTVPPPCRVRPAAGVATRTRASVH